MMKAASGGVDAVADQLFEDELARASGRMSVPIMADLSKCYERLQHQRQPDLG